MFTIEQRYKILRFLNQALIRIYQNDYGAQVDRSNRTYSKYPFLLKQEDIWAVLDRLEAEPDQVGFNEIIQIITNLDTIEQNLIKIRSDPNYALLKADVVEFDINQKTAGMVAQRDSLIENLRYELGLHPSPLPLGGTMLLRS